MTGTYVATCKDCRQEYLYDLSYLDSIVARGESRPERCPKCRTLHGREISRIGMPFFKMRPTKGGRPPVLDGVGLGRFVRAEDRTHRFEESVSTIASERHRFAATDEELEQLHLELSTHQVVVVKGPTGSGKSTYMPYCLVSPTPSMSKHWHPQGQVVVTQPRIRAADSIVTYVAALMGAGVGPGREVGVRTSENRDGLDPRNRLAFVTDGVLLNWLRDGRAEALGAIVIDEAHERSQNIDIILNFLKRILPRNPHLRLIVASATIDTGRFRGFFGGDDRVPLVTFSAGAVKGYRRFYRSAEAPALPYRRDTGAIRELMAAAPAAMARQMVAIARGDVRFAVDSSLAPDIEDIDEIPTDVLGFMPTVDSVMDTVTEIRQLLRGDPILERVDVMPLHRQLSVRDQEAATKPKPDPARRRLIVATNIAETSLTIEGLGYVVDSGLILEPSWDTQAAASSFGPKLHSRAGCRQRWGRVGRYAPGIVHTLYREDQFDDASVFDEFTAPEILRSPAEQVLLRAHAAGVDPRTLDWIDRPPDAEFERAAATLRRRGALDTDGHLTAKGLELSGGDMDEMSVLIVADQLACAVEAATVLALLGQRSSGGPYLEDPRWNADTRRAARRSHQALRTACRDDVDLYLKLAIGWAGEYGGPGRDAWASRHYLNPAFLRVAVDSTRWTMLQPLSRGKSEAEFRAIDLGLADRVRLAFAAAMPDRIFAQAGRGMYQQEGAADDAPRLRLTQHSVLGGSRERGLRILAMDLKSREGQRTASFAIRLEREWTDIAAGGAILGLQSAQWLSRDADAVAHRVDRLLMDLRLPIGARVTADVIEAQSGAGSVELRDVRCLDPGESASGRARLLAWPATDRGSALLPPTGWGATGDGWDPEGVGAEGLDAWEGIDPELLEDADATVEDGLSAPDTRPSAAPSLDCYRATIDGEGVAPGWRMVGEVCALDTDAAVPTVLLRRSSDPSPAARFASRYGDLDEVEVRVVGMDLGTSARPADAMTLNGLVVEHMQTGHQVVLDASDASLTGHPETLRSFPPGSTVQAVVMAAAGGRPWLTLLPWLCTSTQDHIRSAVRETVDGVVLDIAPDGTSAIVELPGEGGSDPALGVRMSVEGASLHVGETARCVISDPMQRTARVHLARLPHGVTAANLPSSMANPDGGSGLTHTGPMTAATWRSLAALSTGAAWRAALMELLRESNVPVARLDDAIAADPCRQPAVGAELAVHLVAYTSDGVVVQLEDGTRRFVPRDRLGVDGSRCREPLGGAGTELRAQVIAADPEIGSCRTYAGCCGQRPPCTIPSARAGRADRRRGHGRAA